MYISGGITVGLEICITFSTEYVKTQLQLESNTLRSPVEVTRSTENIGQGHLSISGGITGGLEIYITFPTQLS